jgi:hypothetical protein
MATKYFINSVPTSRRFLPAVSWKKEMRADLTCEVAGYCYLADSSTYNLGPYPRLKALLRACPSFDLRHLFLLGSVLHYDLSRKNDKYLEQLDMWLFYDFPVGADSYFGRRQWQTPGLCYLKDPDAFYIGTWPSLLEVAENFQYFDFSKVVVVSQGRLHYDSELPSMPLDDSELSKIMSVYGAWKIGGDHFRPNWDLRATNPLQELFFAADHRLFREIDEDSSGSLATTNYSEPESADSSFTQDTVPETIDSEMFEEPWQDELGGYSAVVKRFWRKNMYDFGAGNMFETQLALRRKVVQDLDLEYPIVPRMLFVEVNHVRTEIFPHLDHVYHADEGIFPRLYQTRRGSADPPWLDVRRVDTMTAHFSDVHAIFQALNRRMFILLEDKRPFMWLATEHLYKAKLKAQHQKLNDERTVDARRSLFTRFRHGVSEFHFATLLLAMNFRVIYSRRRDSVITYYSTGSRGEHPIAINRAGYVLFYDQDDLVTVYFTFKDVVTLLDAPPLTRTYFCADFVDLFERCVERDIFPERVQSVFELLRICAQGRVIFTVPPEIRIENVSTSTTQTQKVLRFYRRVYGDDAVEPAANKVGVYNLPAPKKRDGTTADYPVISECIFRNFDITLPAMEAGKGCCAVKLVNCHLRRIEKYTSADKLLKSWSRKAAIHGYAYFTLKGCVRNRLGPAFPVYHVENFGVVSKETLVELHRQRAFVGLSPLTIASMQTAAFLFAYFGVMATIDRTLDNRAVGHYCPGYCYKRVTDQDLGAWPTLRQMLHHATKNLHLSVTSNGFWCHVHTYAVPNSPSVASLLSEFRGTEHWSRWDKRVGAATIPIARLVPTDAVEAEAMTPLFKSELDRLQEINYNLREVTRSVKRLEAVAFIATLLYLTTSQDVGVCLIAPTVAFVLWFKF